jgi:hypothetical protein
VSPFPDKALPASEQRNNYLIIEIKGALAQQAESQQLSLNNQSAAGGAYNCALS